MKNIKYALVLILACSLTVAAQSAAPKLAVYVFGTIDANLNKSLSNKLLAAMVQNGVYTWVDNPESFQTELASKKNVSFSQISQSAKQRGADFVCAVNLIGASGVYSISASLVKTANSQIIKNASLNRTLKSMDDLTAATNELAKQLLPAATPSVAAPPPTVSAPSPAYQTTKKQCSKIYRINDIVSRLEDNFSGQLRDCSSKVKEMNASKKKNAEKKDTKIFMKQCAIDGAKKDLPEDFPGTDKVLGLVENFVQNYVDGAGIDVLLSDVKRSLGPNECVMEPPSSTPPPPKLAPVAPPMNVATKDSVPSPPPPVSSSSTSSGGYLGIRTGINFSHLYSEAKIFKIDTIENKLKAVDVDGTYGDVLGFQVGVVLDLAVPTNWLHIQPGIMYTQKGTKNNGVSATAHYIEIPVLLSLNVSILRLNLGPYFGICLGSGKDEIFAEDLGLNAGLGVDIMERFYIGAFYDYGLFNMSYMDNFKFYNRTLGLNLGVNL